MVEYPFKHHRNLWR